ncbi:MAG: sulfatase [Nanoarchaeota archaeon]|nr:sulfatase [Nanoarchaeota archaeon]
MVKKKSKMRKRNNYAAVIYLVVFLIILIVTVAVFAAYKYGDRSKDGSTNIPENQNVAFSKASETVINHIESVAEKAQYWTQGKALQSLPKNPINGFYYLFDEELESAIIQGQPYLSEIDPLIFSLEFDENDQNSLVILDSEDKQCVPIMREDVLKINCPIKLKTSDPTNIPTNDIGYVEIRAKHEKGKVMTLSWSANEFGINQSHMDIYTIPDGEFHVYLIKADIVMRNAVDSKDNIQRLLLKLTDTDQDTVEIDYIRMLSRKKNYVETPVGLDYQVKADEMRKVIYTQIPISLSYTFNVPSDNVVLSFGLGILENNPVAVAVDINDKELFSERIQSSSKWHDYKFTLAGYSGESVNIVFRTESDEANIVFWSNPVLYAKPREKFNVIFIIEDALRADHLSSYGYYRNTTPIKDALAKKGILFKNAFSQATTTRPSVPAYMTSLYPTATGVWNFNQRLDDNYLTLAEVMSNQGFQTTAFTENPNAGPVAGLHQGYDYLFEQDQGPPEWIYRDAVVEWIENNRDRNFFLYLHLIDPHGVYDPPEEYRMWFDDSSEELDSDEYVDAEWVSKPTKEGRIGLYDGEIRNNDQWFSVFLEKLEEMDLIDHTLIVFTADHGEFLGEHDMWGHRPPSYRQVLNVPLIMHYPKGLPKNRVVTQNVQLIDIMPTILDLAQIDKDPLLLEGQSLVPLINNQDMDFWNNRIIVSEEALNKYGQDDTSIWGSIFYLDNHILHSPKLKTIHYNFMEDLEEEQGIIVKNPDEYISFFNALQLNNRNIRISISKEEGAIEYDPDALEQLKALGYLN